MVYFDNAATTFPKPPSVTEEVNRCINEYCGNPGRSGHRLSLFAAERIYEARESIGRHFSFDRAENIVFTYNATYALNIAIRSLIPNGADVLCSDIEHNAVIRPLSLLKREGYIDYSIFCSSGDIEENIKTKLTPKTRAIVSTLSSNVTGKKIPIDILSRVSKELGLLLIVDASQSAGHEEFNLGKTPCDAFCAPGHKGLFGIQGSGFIIFGQGTFPKQFISGGSGTNSKSTEMPESLPERSEAGTLATPAIASLARGIDFINEVGIREIARHERDLCDRLKSGLSVIRGIRLYDTDGSIVLFNFEPFQVYRLSSELDKYGICVRDGFHCAPSAHIKLGTEKTGAVRASLSYFNTAEEVDAFLKTVNKIAAEI